MKKSLILTICTVIMLIAMMIPLTVGASAGSDLQIECTVTAQTETSVMIDVSVTSNPGFMYLELTKDFPSEFSLTSISNGSLISDLTKGTKYIWIADEDVTRTGTLCTLMFSIPQGTAPGNYTVSLGVGMCGNYDEQDVGVSISSCTVTVVCKHNFTKEDTSAIYLKSEATCTSPAIYYKSCATCGEKGTETFEYGATAEHFYTKQVTTDAYKKSSATCTSKAVYYYCCATCTKAGTNTYEYGTTLSHNYTRKVVTDTYKKSAATCTEAAVYYYCCATCDAKGTTTYTNGSELGHTGGTAICTAKAECTRCHQPYGSMLEHVYTAEDATDAYLKSAATCTSKAVYYKNCATCDKAGTATFEYGSTEPHSYTKQVTTDAYKKSSATCTSKAVYYYCCATCTKAGTNTYEYGTTLDHNYTRKVVTDTYKKSAATCTEAAVYYYCCATCDAKGTETYTNGTKLGHTGGTATCTTLAVCTRCSQPYGSTLPHTYDKTVATDTYLASGASCTAKAKYNHSCICGAKGTTTFENGETLPHTFTKKDTSSTYLKDVATCQKVAEYYYCCQTCTAKGSETYTDGTVAEHKYTKKEITDTYKVSDADCNNAATYYYCCQTCTAKGTETYTNGTKLGHTGGTATCTSQAVCTRCNQSYGGTLAHSYTNKITTSNYLYSSASCTSKALYYYSCDCGAKGNSTFEVGSLVPHDYTEKTISDSYLKSSATCTTPAIYYYSCSSCGEKGDTTFENGTAPGHKYNTEWSKDANGHWHECSACGDKKDSASHTAGAAATEYTAQTCTVCSYVITPALGHTHKYETQWSSDGTAHWHACSGCNEVKDKANHSFTNACDTDCNTCGYERSITHSFDAEWKTDGDKHWHQCKECGVKSDEANHTPGAEATETTDQKCTVCGYVIKEALGHTHSYGTIWNSDSESHWHECACGEKGDKALHSFDNGVITKEATVDAEGEMTYTCTVCNATKKGTIAKLPAPTTPDEPDAPAEPDTPEEPTEPEVPAEPENPAVSDKDTTDKNDNNSVIVFVIIGAAVAVMAVVVIIIIKKRR